MDKNTLKKLVLYSGSVVAGISSDLLVKGWMEQNVKILVWFFSYYIEYILYKNIHSYTSVWLFPLTVNCLSIVGVECQYTCCEVLRIISYSWIVFFLWGCKTLKNVDVWNFISPRIYEIVMEKKACWLPEALLG